MSARVAFPLANAGLALLASIPGVFRQPQLLAGVLMLWALLLLAVIRHRSRRQASCLEERLAGALRFAVTAGALSPPQAESRTAPHVPLCLAAIGAADAPPDAVVE
jgi:hypothetical protein